MDVEKGEVPEESDLSADDVDIPQNSHCPRCGEQATEESIAKIRLSHNGYIHGDVFFQCSSDECTNEWIHGVPVGQADHYEGELWCDACDESWYRVHRIVPHVNIKWDMEEWELHQIQLHIKCPNCFHFDRIKRDPDEQRVALVGWPMITGEIDETCESYGWKENPALDE